MDPLGVLPLSPDPGGSMAWTQKAFEMNVQPIRLRPQKTGSGRPCSDVSSVELSTPSMAGSVWG